MGFYGRRRRYTEPLLESCNPRFQTADLTVGLSKLLVCVDPHLQICVTESVYEGVDPFARALSGSR
jgi:hypothetical protein